VVHNHAGGTCYFVVDSYGSWTFTVTGSGAGGERVRQPTAAKGKNPQADGSREVPHARRTYEDPSLRLRGQRPSRAT
jgi:hypothetical protein